MILGYIPCWIGSIKSFEICRLLIRSMQTGSVIHEYSIMYTCQSRIDVLEIVTNTFRKYHVLSLYQ